MSFSIITPVQHLAEAGGSSTVLTLAAVNRYFQIVIWVFLAPLFGAIQGSASFAFVMLMHGNLGSPDLRRVLAGLALVYGGCWFILALVVSDLFFLRRTLSRGDFARYTSWIALTALVLGFLTPGRDGYDRLPDHSGGDSWMCILTSQKTRFATAGVENT